MTSGQQIESPLSAFHNIQTKITNEFEKIIFVNKRNYKNNKNKPLLSMHNLIIFDCNTITLMGYIKLVFHRDELLVKITKPLNQEDLAIVSNIYSNWDEVSLNFFKYISMYDSIAKNYDSVPTQLINNIIIKFEKHLFNYKENNLNSIEIDNFLIPFKNKINKKYDENKHYIENIYNRYEYLLKLHIINKTNFEYQIIRVLSSELNENKNELNNIRYSEQDLIRKGTLKTFQIKLFVNSLFNYGEII